VHVLDAVEAIVVVVVIDGLSESTERSFLDRDA
jgi:hypothetical protein